MFEIFNLQLQEWNSTYAFHILRSDSVCALMLLQQGGPGEFSEKKLNLTLNFLLFLLTVKTVFFASECLEPEMAAVLCTPAFGGKKLKIQI